METAPLTIFIDNPRYKNELKQIDMKQIILAVAALMMVGCSTTPKDGNIEIVRDHIVKQLTAFPDVTVDANKIEITKCDYSVANPVLLETAITLAETDYNRYLLGDITWDEYNVLCRERLDVAERVISSWIDADKVDSLRYKGDDAHPTYKVVAPFVKYSVVDDTLRTFIFIDGDRLISGMDITDQVHYLNEYLLDKM